MPFQVSPGVNVTEYDLTSVIPAAAGTFGAVAGDFPWGPVNIAQPISTEQKLVERFGKPPYGGGTQTQNFYTAANFLQYSGNLLVVRAAASTTNNAIANNNTATSVSRQIKNSNDYVSNSTITGGWFAARYPGALGNNITVSVWANASPVTSVNTSSWAYGSVFDRANTGTTDYVSRNFYNKANDEIFVVVVDRTGAISGTPNTVLEKFIASKATNARDENNNSMYYKDVLLNRSRYVYQVGEPTGLYANSSFGTGWGNAANATAIFSDLPSTSANTTRDMFLATENSVADSDVLAAYTVLEDPTLDVSLVMTSGLSNTSIINSVVAIAEARKDAVVFVSPTYANTTAADPVSAIVNFRRALSYSSYAVMDSGWKYQYDKYHDTYRWIPLNGDVAGTCARTDAERQPWFSPAGPVRGQIKGIVKLSYNPDKSDRDTLYTNDVNPVVAFNGEGTYLYGDKTMLGRQSAFNRINVRRLFIQLEKVIARAAKASMFEFNDEFTRSQFVSIVDPYLRQVQAGRGIYDYRVICDERNNTADVIDRNEFVGDIYIKPAKSVNFIQLNFIAIRTGVQFEEVIGRATV